MQDPEPQRRPSFQEIIQELEHVMVDVAISDEVGNKFWKKYFFKQENVPWPSFSKAIKETLQFPDSQFKELNFKCFEAVVAQKNKDNEEIVNIEQFGRVCNWFGPLEVNVPPTYSLFDRVTPNINFPF